MWHAKTPKRHKTISIVLLSSVAAEQTTQNVVAENNFSRFCSWLDPWHLAFTGDRLLSCLWQGQGESAGDVAPLPLLRFILKETSPGCSACSHVVSSVQALIKPPLETCPFGQCKSHGEVQSQGERGPDKDTDTRYDSLGAITVTIYLSPALRCAL